MPVPARPRPPSPPARPDDQLRGHVRLLGTLLGQTLVHQEGEALLELEEAVRAKTKQLRERHDPVVRRALDRELGNVGVATATRLIRRRPPP